MDKKVKMKLLEFIDKYNESVFHNHLTEQMIVENCLFTKEIIEKHKMQSFIYNIVTFKDIILINCDLTGSYFFECKFINAQFLNCTFHKSEFYNSDLSSTLIEKSMLSKCDFNNSNLSKITLDHSSLDWSFFNNCDFRETSFLSTTMSGAIIANSKMYNINKQKILFDEKFPLKLQNIDFSFKGDGSKMVSEEKAIAILI